ncbi:ataxin-2 homolog [Palaemon carinicauda]|uniref:ataxin-2 homolog n=1 Tax=Palaemon carinicauda TaxID=392227 RepID=UPI0035B5C71F
MPSPFLSLVQPQESCQHSLEQQLSLEQQRSPKPQRALAQPRFLARQCTPIQQRSPKPQRSTANLCSPLPKLSQQLPARQQSSARQHSPAHLHSPIADQRPALHQHSPKSPARPQSLPTPQRSSDLRRSAAQPRRSRNTEQCPCALLHAHVLLRISVPVLPTNQLADLPSPFLSLIQPQEALPKLAVECQSSPAFQRPAVHQHSPASPARPQRLPMPQQSSDLRRSTAQPRHSRK